MKVVRSLGHTVNTKEKEDVRICVARNGCRSHGNSCLDITTSMDMTIRGRSSSNTPSKLIHTIAEKIHLPLSSQGVRSQDQTAQNRESGLGALLGYVNGLDISGPL